MLIGTFSPATFDGTVFKLFVKLLLSCDSRVFIDVGNHAVKVYDTTMTACSVPTEIFVRIFTTIAINKTDKSNPNMK